MERARKNKSLEQAVGDLWVKQVQAEEKRQCVQKVMNNLQNLQDKDRLRKDKYVNDEKKRKRMQRTLSKIRERKAAAADKRSRRKKALFKFRCHLAGFFVFNMFLILVGIFVLYYISKAN